jgi:hypothetical protein
METTKNRVMLNGGKTMLGNNRDYKTADRRARNRLAVHAELMARYISHGMSREEASKLALRHMEHPDEEAAYERDRYLGGGYALGCK